MYFRRIIVTLLTQNSRSVYLTLRELNIHIGKMQHFITLSFAHAITPYVARSVTLFATFTVARSITLSVALSVALSVTLSVTPPPSLGTTWLWGLTYVSSGRT